MRLLRLFPRLFCVFLLSARNNQPGGVAGGAAQDQGPVRRRGENRGRFFFYSCYARLVCLYHVSVVSCFVYKWPEILGQLSVAMEEGRRGRLQRWGICKGGHEEPCCIVRCSRCPSRTPLQFTSCCCVLTFGKYDRRHGTYIFLVKVSRVSLSFPCTPSSLYMQVCYQNDLLAFSCCAVFFWDARWANLWKNPH